MSFKILFEDEHFIAVEKPAGLPSQATVDKRRPDFFTELKKELLTARQQDDFYLALHHRLDRDTSGVMIFAKAKSANTPLADMFKKHQIQKTYLCLTKKHRCPDDWEVDNHLAEKRDAKLKKMKMISVQSGGDKALTHFHKLKELKYGLVIQAQPMTGRMHQIRVHLAERGLGIFGDDIYGSAKEPAAPRLMLHAFSLEFTHPFSGEFIRVECPWPADMQAFEELLNKES